MHLLSEGGITPAEHQIVDNQVAGEHRQDDVKSVQISSVTNTCQNTTVAMPCLFNIKYYGNV